MWAPSYKSVNHLWSCIIIIKQPNTCLFSFQSICSNCVWGSNIVLVHEHGLHNLSKLTMKD